MVPATFNFLKLALDSKLSSHRVGSRPELTFKVSPEITHGHYPTMSVPKLITETVASYATFKPSDATAEALLDVVPAIVEADHAIHLFSETSINKDNATSVMGQYFAMSQAFPYLQVSEILTFFISVGVDVHGCFHWP
jgi:hypothetical protein